VQQGTWQPTKQDEVTKHNMKSHDDMQQCNEMKQQRQDAQ
jgi:hypothetical protein